MSKGATLLATLAKEGPTVYLTSKQLANRAGLPGANVSMLLRRSIENGVVVTQGAERRRTYAISAFHATRHPSAPAAGATCQNITYGPSYTHDPRFQFPEGHVVHGEFSRLGPGRYLDGGL